MTSPARTFNASSDQTIFFSMLKLRHSYKYQVIKQAHQLSFFLLLSFTSLFYTELVYGQQVLQVYDVQEEVDLDIDLKTAGSLTLIGWDRHEILVEAETRGPDGDLIDLKIAERSDGLTIRTKYTKNELNFSGGIDFKIKTPRHANLSFSTHGGSIHLENLEGNFMAHTAGSKVYLQNMKGTAEVSSTGGQIKVADFEGDVVVTTTGSDIRVQRIDGSLSAKTTHANIEATMIGDPEQGHREVTMETVYGDLSLYVLPELSMDVDASIAYTRRARNRYQISSHFELEQTRTQEWDDQYGPPMKTLNGKGEVNGGRHMIVLKTVNGNITLQK